MAFYAELVRKHWYCVNQFNAITWCRKKLYDEWYNSLTDEQRELLEKRKKEKEDRNTRELLMFFGMCEAVMNRLTNGRPGYYSYGQTIRDVKEGIVDAVATEGE